VEKEAFFKGLDNIRGLPTLPEVAVKLNRLLSDPETTVEIVVDTVKQDPAIVGKMLQLVNSSFYGLGKTVTSVSRAVVILGFNMIRNALVSVSVIDSMKCLGGAGVELKSFWRHAISCAVIGRHLSLRTGIGLPEEVFTVGIVHDIGKLVLAKYYREEFSEILTNVAGGQTFFDAENGIIPVHHNEIGAHLARRWGLPQVICDGIQFSHGAERLNSYPVSGLVFWANNLAHSGEAFDRDRYAAQSSGGIMDRLWPEVESRGEWLPTVVLEIEAACSILLDGGANEG
jgi:HD-like signal output (HDOD) protein